MKMTGSSPMLGIRRGRPAKHHRPRRFLRKYLKTDSYMFAPIISKRKSGFATGFEIGDGKEEKKKKRFMEWIREYLTSDSYLYSPLLQEDNSGTSRKETVSHGTRCLTKRVTTSIARTVLTKNTAQQPTEEPKDAIAEGHIFDTKYGSDSGSDQISKQGEILEQVGFPKGWKSLLSEGDLPINSSIAERVAHRRKIPVE